MEDNGEELVAVDPADTSIVDNNSVAEVTDQTVSQTRHNSKHEQAMLFSTKYGRAGTVDRIQRTE